MNGTASLLVAKDIQQRMHAQADQDRRLADTASDATATAGIRWIVRLSPSLPRRRRMADRVNS